MLLITKSDGQIVATTLDELDALLDKLGPALFSARLADLPLPLTACVTAEAADERATRGRGKILVVTSKARPVGFLFDFYRGLVLEKFGLTQPESVEDEQFVWLTLEVFLRRGEGSKLPPLPRLRRRFNPFSSRRKP